MENKDTVYTITIPRTNPNDDVLDFKEWLVADGAEVERDTLIALVETTKASVEVEAGYAGFLHRLIEVGKDVPVGTAMALITKTPVKPSNFKDYAVPVKAENNKAQTNTSELEVTLKAKQLMETHGLTLEDFKGMSGILKTIDVERVLEKRNAEILAKSADKLTDEEVPSYRRNYIGEFKNLKHGKNCFIAEGATLTNVKLGEQVWINKFATIYGSKGVEFGSGCYVGPYVWIEGHAGIEIGDCVHIAGPGTCLYTHSGMKIALNGELVGNPDYENKVQTNNYFEVPIKIGNNVWIGPNCTIFPGVIIKDHVVVMPNTLVKAGIIEPYSLVKGDGVVEKNSSFVKSLCK